MTAIATATPFYLESAQYQFDIYSSGGAGTMALTFAADGTNYRTVDVSAEYSGTGSGGFVLTAGQDDSQTAKWQVTLTGDAVCNYFRVKDI